MKVKGKADLSFTFAHLRIFHERYELLDNAHCASQVALVFRKLHLYHLKEDMGRVGLLEILIHREGGIHCPPIEIVFFIDLIRLGSEDRAPLRNTVYGFPSAEDTYVFFR